MILSRIVRCTSLVFGASVLVLACSSADPETPGQTQSALRADTPTPSPAPTAVPSVCPALLGEVCRLYDNLQSACSLEHLGTPCTIDAIGRNRCDSCTAACGGPSSPGDEACFAQCQENRCNCIHNRFNYPRYQAAKHAARDAGCEIVFCSDPCVQP